MKSIVQLLCVFLSPLPVFADITLVRDGKAEAVIIVPEGLYKVVQKPAGQLTSESVAVPLAAVELADYVAKISGVRPQIATETQKGMPEGPRIYIGHCKANAQFAPLPEEIVIETRGADLHRTPSIPGLPVGRVQSERSGTEGSRSGTKANGRNAVKSKGMKKQFLINRKG